MHKKIRVLLIFSFTAIFILGIASSSGYAQSEETLEQRALSVEDRAGEAFETPDTVQQLLEMLKERAKLKIEEKRKELLRKTKISASLLVGFESNPLNDSSTKGDYYVEEDFSISWLPTFNKYLGADIGYWVVNQDFFEQTDISIFDHALNATFKLYPFGTGRFSVEPGAEYEWLWYPKDENSSYDAFKQFFKFKHYIGEKWNYGGRYEHSFKIYDKKQARDAGKSSIGINREDNRHTFELYLTRYIGRYSVKLKGKAYRNTSNDHYQEYYDYDSYRGYLTISRTFLKDDKLYISYTPSFEYKDYQRRLAVDTARYDDITHHKLSAYYTLVTNVSLGYSFTYKRVDSNYALGEYKDITNQIGLYIDF